MMEKEISSSIRNFCILSHIDHGKSTLADRFLELTHTIEEKDMRDQFLDRMDLEREKGITIKMKPIQMRYTLQTNDSPSQEYILNLIDTPGHVDFSYEVSRALKAVEGGILLVDATKGIQAQTVFNYYLAQKEGLSIIPAINKIDLPLAQIEKTKEEMAKLLKIEKDKIELISAKLGTNVKRVLERVIKEVPPPQGKEEGKLKALIFDSLYDIHKGIIAFVRVFDGKIKKGDEIKFLKANKKARVIETGIFKKNLTPQEELKAGEIGYIITNLSEIKDYKIGDTISHLEEEVEPIKGFVSLRPMVFATFYPALGEDYLKLKNSLEKLSLNDPAITFEPETTGLGQGFKIGFLGPLHLEVVQERLEREYHLNIVSTPPQTSYKIIKRDQKEEIVSSVSKFPKNSEIKEIQEPWLKIKIFTPFEYTNQIFELMKQKRGIYKEMEYLSDDNVILIFEMPLVSLLEDFYDKLKSISSGFASFDWEFLEYRPDDLVKVDILVAGEVVDPLSFVSPFSSAYSYAKNIVLKLKKVLPREQFEVSLQAAIGSRVIVRENIPPLRKNVLAKLYGGDRTRKDKLLEKQKEGKKRLKQIGKVRIPQEAFFAILKK
jgi:GTP-binding protein LepA